MKPKRSKPLATTCSCGAPLRWERHGHRYERPSLALCRDPQCGYLSVAQTGETGPEDALKTHLIGDASPARYEPPWLRLFLRSLASGCEWKPAMTTCVACASRLSFELLLNPQGNTADLYRACLCVSCGWTTMARLLNGESSTLAMEGGAWDEPPAVLSALRRALKERSPDGWQWDFLR
jgi:hypothetical protein